MGKGKHGNGHGKPGKGKGKRPMSSADQAQYATMEEGDFDWEHGGGSHDWNWEPTEQAVCMTDSQNQRAPLDMTPGPIYLMREPEGGAWSFMSLRRWKQPTMTTMPRVTLSRPPGLGIMSLQVPCHVINDAQVLL